MSRGGGPVERPPRSLATLVLLGSIAALVFVALVGLGVWQIERRAWKHALIAQIDARLHAAPVPAPGPDAWPHITAADAYSRVALNGVYQPGRDVFVKAVTARGAGFWAVSPFRTVRGFTVLVNRGFVAQPKASVPAGATHITGLLRVSEPGGGFLRSNDPAGDHWYSRDVTAIARAKRSGVVAPYFVDADAASSERGGPIGGMTVVRFSDNHLVYALTWFGLAALLLLGVRVVIREELRVRRASLR